MIVHRLTSEQFKDDISGTGAKLFGGRWNSVGIPVLYATENISLAVLEILVRTGINHLPLNYFLLRLDIPEHVDKNLINKYKLKKEWKADVAYTQWIGNQFIKSNKGLVLKIPSAIVDEEHNFMINTNHADFKKVKISACKKFSFDRRLYVKNE